MKINFWLASAILSVGLFLVPDSAMTQSFELEEEEQEQIIEQIYADLLQAFTEVLTEEVEDEARVFPGFMGIVDVVYGTKETRRTTTITGSDLVGFKFPCFRECAYIELAGLRQLAGLDNVHGKQWISGKHQKVFGGTGALGALYNFREPTGRFPLSPEFKFVLWDVDESKGKAEFRAFYRVCNPAPFNCTPYVLPPNGIPIFTLYEKDTIFLGVIEPDL